jgi:isohexenylglutaconyl-CoA hydratase
MADYANIKLERDGAVARLVLNRPDRRNALTHAMMLELEDAFTRLRDDQSCRAVVLRGAGGHFCAGGDLDAMADMPPPPANGAIDPLVSAYRHFGMPEPKVGFIPSQIIPFVVRRVGEGAARDLVVTGRVIDAAEAHRLGIGRHLCANTAEINRTLKAVLDDVLRLEPEAVGSVKRLVLSCATADDRAVLDDAARTLVDLLRRPQASDGIRHFMAKTLPPWAKE